MIHSTVTTRVLGIAAAFGLAVCALSGCGGSSAGSASTSTLATGESAGSSIGNSAPPVPDVAKYLDPTSSLFDYSRFVPTGPVAVKAGERIAIVTSSLASPQAVQFADAIKTAAADAHWTAQAYDGQYSVNVESALISQAVEQKYNGIVLAGITPSTVPSPIAAAKSAGIPVVDMFGYGDVDNGVTDIGNDPISTGTEVGQWIVSDSHGAAKVAVFTLPPGGAASGVINAFENALSSTVATCSGCEVIKETMDVTDATAPGTPRYVSFLQQHPKGNIDYVASGFETGMINYAKTDQQVGRTEIKTVGGLASSDAGVAAIESNSGPVVAPSVPLTFVALAIVDAIARRLAGQPASNILLPAPLITAANAADFSQGVFTPATDYTKVFEDLWTQS